MQEILYATNLVIEPSPRKPMHSNGRRINETNMVSTTSAICAVRTKHSRREPIETCEEYQTMDKIHKPITSECYTPLSKRTT
jgi:hypothetical protein